MTIEKVFVCKKKNILICKVYVFWNILKFLKNINRVLTNKVQAIILFYYKSKNCNKIFALNLKHKNKRVKMFKKIKLSTEQKRQKKTDDLIKYLIV